MSGISRATPIPDKLACITIDFELDYGDRTGQFNILHESREQLDSLTSVIRDLGIPVTAFLQTSLLETHPKCRDLRQTLAVDFHSHSHTHNTREFRAEEEIARSLSAFEKEFGFPPLGYRAPQGVLRHEELDILKRYGFRFSSSIFPAYRPGKFSHLSSPLSPFMYENGIVELPFAVVPVLRYIVSLSYLKLIGFRTAGWLISRFGLSRPLVFDSHLHDYIVNEKSFRQLPRGVRWAYGINKHSGIRIFERFVERLRSENWRFITMTELYRIVSPHEK